MELKTPLYDVNVRSGGKMVSFAGYMMPIQYETGIIKEHMAVRNEAGLFDVSHMGEFFLTGKDSLENIQNLLTNDYSKMQIGQVKYSPMCNHEGGVVDDLLVYKMSDEKYMLVVNASNMSKDFAWIEKHLTGDAKLEDKSSETALIALQGPKTFDILKKLDILELPQKYYSFIENGKIDGIDVLISRTGYTGETGLEFYLKASDAETLWSKLIEAGKEFGLIPAGLGARDTLRLEAGMPLYGHEMTEEITPIEAGLDFFVKFDKETFIGKEALQKNASNKKRTGIFITDKGIARDGAKVSENGKEIGYVTSGTLAPFVNKAICCVLVDESAIEIGKKVTVDVRGRILNAEMCALPFYKKQ